MKKLIAILLIAVCMLSMTGCSEKWIKGTEETYRGTITDRGMSVVKEGDRNGRPYLILATENEEEICFWLGKNCETDAGIGDAVVIDSAVEERTGLLTAVCIAEE